MKHIELSEEGQEGTESFEGHEETGLFEGQEGTGFFEGQDEGHERTESGVVELHSCETGVFEGHEK